MDIGTPEFEKFQAVVLNHVRAQNVATNLKVELMAIRIDMEDYVLSESTSEVRRAGDFLRDFLKVLGIRQNKFAEYLGINPSNLNKLLSGERPINSQIALILGQIFDVDPMLWLEVLYRNELRKLYTTKQQELERFSLKDLITD